MNENQANLQTNNEGIQMDQQNQSIQQSQANQRNQNSQQNQGSLQKTILNGKSVPLHEVQMMEEQFNMQNSQTGIQQHHDNSSEAVQAGQVGQNQVSPQQEQLIKRANVQSGQSHLSQNFSQGQQPQQSQQTQQAQQAQQSQQSQAQIQKQEDHQTIQNSIDETAKAKAKTKKEN